MSCSRRENLEARKERQEKRERKELVERLLAEYEQKQQQELHMAQYVVCCPMVYTYQKTLHFGINLYA